MKRQIASSIGQVKHPESAKTGRCVNSSQRLLDIDFFSNITRSLSLQWDSGEDAGMYSEVKTDAIRRYDDTKVDDDGYPQTDYSAAVEWQKGKKPKHGWPVYMASIKFVSNNRYHTNAKIKEFLGLESDERNKPLPKKRTSVPPSRYTDSDETDVENTNPKEKDMLPK
ncbi:hypothetical protein G5714_004625 [Onychostoma macrolepis]|uniref:Uncharacterized protein n=1 Tax=Onychostoma macrolepis TaxID=369639 RepID=A0A7J6D5C0_9TELE|nr:hypothetical protein G5714_004625 [Onychostoma macrolepis]